VDERFEADMRAGYPADPRALTLGSPLRVQEVLADVRVRLPLSTVNRHGLVAGATGTGKTKTLQVIAGQLSDAGVPVFVADVKGDLSGLAQPIDPADPRVAERAASLTWTIEPRAHPVELLSLTGTLGAPVRATVESFGPVLLAKVLDLNQTQTAVLTLVFRLCDDRELPLLDLADLRAALRFLGSDEGKPVLEAYGGVSKASIGVVLRSILTLEEAGAGAFFGEPPFDVQDLLRTDGDRGVISLLELSDVMDRPRLFSTFMLWLLARLYATLPEVGDLETPVLAFFFDEAHLLFDDASDALLEQIELTARLIRSKGVGVFFVTHAPTDVPKAVLGQLGNRIQHALRAFTPQDADDLRRTARTFPTTEHYDVEEALTSLGIGEALVTVLSADGTPSPLAWTRIVPPDSRMAPADEDVLAHLIARSPLRIKTFAGPDRQSAAEILDARLASAEKVAATPPPPGRRERSVFGTLHVSRR
jgi:DNA double-strand break repair helicase HerA and related ATPase